MELWQVSCLVHPQCALKLSLIRAQAGVYALSGDKCCFVTSDGLKDQTGTVCAGSGSAAFGPNVLMVGLGQTLGIAHLEE